MGIFDKIKSPVVLKEDSSSDEQLHKLEELQAKLNGVNRDKITREIYNIKSGINGENNVLFHLKNSYTGMYVLRDIYLQDGENSAQIDFVVITHKHIFVIECKNYAFNIEVKSDGAFTYNDGKKVVGFDSPIDQNRRHLGLIKQIRGKDKNIIEKTGFERFFDSNYISLVVFSNEKIVINDKFAKYDVKRHICRADQLVERIKDFDLEGSAMGEKAMKEIADFFLENNKPNLADYTIKFTELSEEQETKDDSEIKQNDTTVPDDEKNTVLSCIECSGELVLRNSKSGSKFYGCSNFPKCRTIINISGNDIICPQCKSNMVKRTNSKTGQEFLGCSGYPKCRKIINIKKSI